MDPDADNEAYEDADEDDGDEEIAAGGQEETVGFCMVKDWAAFH